MQRRRRMQRQRRTSPRRGPRHTSRHRIPGRKSPRRATRLLPRRVRPKPIALRRSASLVPAARALRPWLGTRPRREPQLARSSKSAADMPAAAVTRELHNRTSGKI
jgi:hypothetical protein